MAKQTNEPTDLTESQADAIEPIVTVTTNTNPAKEAMKAAIVWLVNNRPKGNHPARPAHERTIAALRGVLITYEKEVIYNGTSQKGG